MLRVYLIIALYVLIPVLIIESFKRWTWAQKTGTVVMAYAIGILFALTGFVHFEPGTTEAASFSKLQSLLMSITVPLGGLTAVIVAIVSGYFIFRNRGIEEFDKVCAMMTGIYTGGTMNFNALGSSLRVDKTTMAIVLAFEMVLTTPYIFFIIGGGFKVFRKILPYQDITRRGRYDEPVQTMDVEDYKGMFRKKSVGGMFLGFGLSVLFLAIAAGLALLLTGKLNELVIILTITTLSIIASFFKKVRELPKTFELGMFFILIFSVIVASLFDIHSVNGGSLTIGMFVCWVMVLSAVLHLIFCRIAHVSGDLFCVSQVALLCSPPFVPPVVGAMQNKKVLISGIVIGLVGYALGTYFGVAIFGFLRMLG